MVTSDFTKMLSFGLQEESRVSTTVRAFKYRFWVLLSSQCKNHDPASRRDSFRLLLVAPEAIK